MRVVLVALAVFGIGLCVISLFERFGSRRRPEAWRALTGEIFVVASILGPALIGGRALAAALVVLGMLAAREMWRVQRSLIGVCCYPGLGVALCAGMAFIGRADAVVFVFAVTELADVAAYLTGKYVGRTPFAPRLSPGKTWEGTIAGLTVAAI